MDRGRRSPVSFSTMSAAAQASSTAPMLRVAAVWGTTVLHLQTLRSGESFEFGERTIPMPDGLSLPDVPVRGSGAGWELDAKGSQGGLVRLRGRDEDPVALARSGAGVPIVPGDFGVIQYGLFSIFFQYTSGAQQAKGRSALELLLFLAILSSIIFHFGLFGMLGALSTPPAIPKPLELTSPEEFAARFRIKRIEEEPPQPVAAEDKGSGVKDPGLHDKKPQGGGQKMKGAEGKFGLKGDKDKSELPGDVKPSTNLGGLSEVLDSQAGKEIRSTLETIKSVSDALGGLNAKDIVLGAGGGMGLKGGGPGGGGTGAGVPFGAGNLNTGAGPGAGGGFGMGGGGLGGRGSGGNGRGGAGGGNGSGNGPGEAKVAVGAATPAAHGGLTPEQVRRVVMAHTGALRACYETEAQRNPNLKGGISVAWQIEPGGNVASAQIRQSQLSNPRVEGCVLRQVKAWRFPTSDAATTVADYPFRFGVGG